MSDSYGSPEIDCNHDELSAPKGELMEGTFKVNFRRRCLNCGTPFKMVSMGMGGSYPDEYDWVEE